MPTPKVYVYCDQNCKYEGMTKEQILTAIVQAIEEGTVGDIDTGFVKTVKTINNVSIKFFYGTQAAYDALTEEEKNHLFPIITNDASENWKEEAAAAIEELLAFKDGFKGNREGAIKIGETAKALTPSSVAIGTNNIAGVYGYYISAIDITNKYIYLATEKTALPVITTDSEYYDATFETPAYLSGTDTVEFCILNGKHYAFISAIASVDHNKISYTDDLGFTTIQGNAEDTDDHIFFVPSKPEIGSITLKFPGTFAAGIDNKAAGGYGVVGGYKNLLGDNYGAIFGRENKGGYACFVSGDYNDGSGENSYVEGRKNTNKGLCCHVEGQENIIDRPEFDEEGYATTNMFNHVEGQLNVGEHISYSHIEGYQNTVERGTTTGKLNHVEGSDNIVTGKLNHVEGYKSTVIGSNNHVEGTLHNVNASYAHVEGNKNTVSSDTAHAEGYDTTASGASSHAEGYSTTASGFRSHAEGCGTTASNYNAHAEGNSTTASGIDSHAEGSSTTASGTDSHTEGAYTKASAYYAHAEGYFASASGAGAHAEGNSTIASGIYSHAEGLQTIASGKQQHVAGKYNVADTDKARITGGGSSDTDRKNIEMLDWDGNAWFSGGVYVGGTDIATAAKLRGYIVETGSYTGTNTHGADNPNILTFDFTPLMVIITYTYNINALPYCGTAVFIRPATKVGHNLFGYNISDEQNREDYVMNVTWGENTLSWYNADISLGQLNALDKEYTYFVIGAPTE